MMSDYKLHARRRGRSGSATRLQSPELVMAKSCAMCMSVMEAHLKVKHDRLLVNSIESESSRNKLFRQSISAQNEIYYLEEIFSFGCPKKKVACCCLCQAVVAS